MSPSGDNKSVTSALRVLHVTETLPGGIATYLRELLSLPVVTQATEEVRVLVPQDQFAHLDALSGDMLRGYARNGRNLRSLWNLAMALRAQVVEFRPQIVHLHSSFGGVVGRLLRPWLPKGVQIVYCPHGWAFSRDDSRILRLAYIWLERWLASCSNAWVAISRHELDAAIAVGIRSDHAHLIYNGVSDTKDVLLASLPQMNPAYINLLFVGRHDRQKGLDIVLSAMGRLPTEQKIRLYVIGGGVIDGGSKKQEADNVIWLGWRFGSELIAYYRACSAVIMPSRWEGMGLVAVEAMREGRAVLASQRGALPEVVGDGGILFDPENPQALSALLSTLDFAQLRACGVRARARYLQYFQGEHMGREIIRLYRKLEKQGHRIQ